MLQPTGLHAWFTFLYFSLHQKLRIHNAIKVHMALCYGSVSAFTSLLHDSEDNSI